MDNNNFNNKTLADFSNIDISDINVNSTLEKVNIQESINEAGFFDNLDDFDFAPKLNIKILGVGGAGNNMINYIAKNSNLDPKMLYAVNTDYQVLKKMNDITCSRVFIGRKTTLGHGSGSDPLIGEKAANEDRKIFSELLKDVDLLFIISGMGKGTGTGASPIIAEIAKELNILTISIVNVPSIETEGKIIYDKGMMGTNNLKKYVDGLATINNDKILASNIKNESLYNSFGKVNQVICETITDLINTITIPSHINIDFNDIKNFFKDKTNFQITNCEFESNENSKEILKQKISTTIFEDKIIGSNKAILTLKLNPNVPSTFIADVRKVIEELTENNNLQLTYSIDYSEQISFARISILIATSNLDNEDNQIDDKVINQSHVEVDYQTQSLQDDCYLQNKETISPPPPPYIRNNTSEYINNLIKNIEDMEENIEVNNNQTNHNINLQDENDAYNLNDLDFNNESFNSLQSELDVAKTNLQKFNNTEELAASIQKQDEALSSTVLNKFISKTLSLFKNNHYNKNND